MGYVYGGADATGIERSPSPNLLLFIEHLGFGSPIASNATGSQPDGRCVVSEASVFFDCYHLNAVTRCQRQWLDRIPSMRRFRISAADIGPKLSHQNRTVSWLMSTPRSCRRSFTFRSDSGNRTYSITARRMISGLVLNHLNGLGLVMGELYAAPCPAAGQVALTEHRPMALE